MDKECPPAGPDPGGRAVAVPMADPQLEFHWIPDPGFLIQKFPYPMPSPYIDLCLRAMSPYEVPYCGVALNEEHAKGLFDYLYRETVKAYMMEGDPCYSPEFANLVLKNNAAAGGDDDTKPEAKKKGKRKKGAAAGNADGGDGGGDDDGTESLVEKIRRLAAKGGKDEMKGGKDPKKGKKGEAAEEDEGNDSMSEVEA